MIGPSEAASVAHHTNRRVLLAERLTEMAGERQSQGRYAEAERLLIRALQISKKGLGLTHPDTAMRMNILGLFYQGQGQCNRSESLYRRALSICEKAQGSVSPDKALCLHNLGTLYREQGRHAQAEPPLREAVEIWTQTLGMSHPLAVHSMNSLAYLLQDLRQYEEAETLLRRVVETLQATGSADHQLISSALFDLIMLYSAQCNNGQPRLLLAKFMSIEEQVLLLDHPDAINCLTVLAQLYMNLGQHCQAEPLLVKVLEIRRMTLGCNHPDTVIILNSLGQLYAELGQYGQAEILLRNALEIREQTLGKDHADTAISADSLGSLYLRQGLYADAEHLLNRALKIRRLALGVNHPDTASSLNALGLLYTEQYQHQKAEPLLIEALQIREQEPGAKAVEIASSANNLGLLYQMQGRYSQAEPLLLRAYGILEEMLGDDHPKIMTCLNNLASLKRDLGQYDQAEEMLLRALGNWEEILGLEHPIATICYRNLVHLYAAQHEHSKIIAILGQLHAAESIFLARELPRVPISRQIQFLRRFDVTRRLSCLLAATYHPAATLALVSRLNRHGLPQEIERRQLEYSRLPGSDRAQAERLAALITALASRDLDPADRAVLQDQRDVLERDLFSKYPEPGIRQCTVEEVATAIPVDGILVEFERVGDLEQYIALILSPEASVRIVNLGSAAELETMIDAALFSSSCGLPEDADQWQQVSNQLMGPLLSELENSRHWFISLDGALHRIPFNALPWPGEPARWLTDTVAITLLTSGRDLLDVGDPIKSEGTSVVVANPSFDHSIVASGIPESDGGGRSRDMGSLDAWDLLPGTAEEGLRVAELLDASLLMESDATTINLQRAVHPRILHAATHGYFLPDQPDPDPEGSMRQIHDSFSPLASFQGEDPMLRSGLVLAGANNPEANPHDDGYLTALEATHLDLQGTELVTLSACDTGRGDIRTGEGVYGLQRALIVAGARSMLLSLWKVPDDATCEFMVRFYTLLKQGAGRYEALVGVQREFRNHSNPIWRDIYYWGAWQLIGDWRPIEGL